MESIETDWPHDGTRSAAIGPALASETAKAPWEPKAAGLIAFFFGPIKNPFVRFHALPCIFLNVACLVLEFAFLLIGSALGWSSLVILPLAGIGLWIVLIFMAYQGRIFKLPVIGRLAEQRANNA